jgi:hypothetical protein
MILEKQTFKSAVVKKTFKNIFVNKEILFLKLVALAE